MPTCSLFLSLLSLSSLSLSLSSLSLSFFFSFFSIVLLPLYCAVPLSTCAYCQLYLILLDFYCALPLLSFVHLYPWCQLYLTLFVSAFAVFYLYVPLLYLDF